MDTPTFDQVMELPTLVEAVVRPDFIDINGHMNVCHYLELNADGTTVVCERVGIDDAYRAKRRMGVFTAEHHIRYYSELHLGEELSVHPVVLDRNEKVVHMMVYLLDRTHRRLSNTLELMLVHVDLDTRRPVPMPAEIAEGFDRFIAEREALPWKAPVCGVMGVRR